MNTTDLVISQVPRMCRTNRCGHYGCTWACPQVANSIEECKERIQRYTNAFVFTTKYDIEDSFDYEGIVEEEMARSSKSKIIKLWKNYCHEFLALTHEGVPSVKIVPTRMHPAVFRGSTSFH